MMYCKKHSCLAAQKIECIKNVRMNGGCVARNEWIAGFMIRNNGTHDLIEVECCRYRAVKDGKFIKNIIFSTTFNNIFDNDTVVENESLGEIAFINNIQKINESGNDTIYSASLYRMKCPETNSTKLNSENLSNKNINPPETIGNISQSKNAIAEKQINFFPETTSISEIPKRETLTLDNAFCEILKSMGKNAESGEIFAKLFGGGLKNCAENARANMKIIKSNPKNPSAAPPSSSDATI